MEKITLDTGKEELNFTIPEDFSYDILKPKTFPAIDNLEKEIRKKLGNPICSQTISNMVKPDQNVTIIINDNTRYVPQDVIVPEILKELMSAGVERSNITIVIATGTHRPNDKEEIVEMLGEEIPEKYRIINHNAYDEDNLINLGKSKELSIPIVVNKTVVESDIVIGIGVIEPHLFAGYSGGVKILSVGTAGIQTIGATHNAKMLEDPTTKFGVVKDNNFRKFLNEVIKVTNLDFIVNVVQDGDKNVLKVVTGDPIDAYKKGVEFAKKVYEVEASKPADIVVSVPKYPKTINLYQATRAANSVIFGEKPLVKAGGDLIIPARCWDGVGSEEFYEDLAKVNNYTEVINKAREEGFPPEGHKAFTISRMLSHCNMYITDTDLSREKISDMKLNYAETIDAAIEELLKKYRGEKKHLVVLPDGIITIPKLK